MIPDQLSGIYDVVIKNNTQYLNRNLYTGIISYQRVPVKLQITDGNKQLPPEVLFGDTVKMQLNLIKIQETPSRYIKPFDRYLMQNQIYLKANTIDSTFSVRQMSKWSTIRSAQVISYYFKTQFEQHTQFPLTAQLLTGLLLGDKSSMEKSIKEAFRIGGISHILAVSGMHLGIFYFILVYFFKQLRKIGIPISYRFEILTVLLIIWIYTLITGLGVAVCRSALMLSLFQISRLFKRNTQPINILFAGASILVFIHPGNLEDIGFQLSCFALLGIFWLSKFTQRILLPSTRLGQFMWSTISVSLGVQLIITPICLYHFHTFPLYFLLTNLIWAPITPVLMLSGILICCINPISHHLTYHLMYLTEFIVRVGLKALQIINDFPYASLEHNWFEATDCILYFAVLFVFYKYLSTHQLKYGMLMFFIQALGSIQYLTREVSTFKSSELIIIPNKFKAEFLLLESGKCYKSKLKNPSLDLYLKRKYINEFRIIKSELVLQYLKSKYAVAIQDSSYQKLISTHQNSFGQIELFPLDESSK
ncbi:MAG: ComEC/Rec2 family competence protein [Saprospiraceae bacterium]|nr:ComEC/Rec2 family competence protein [Saprospiraceae bacterium]